MYDATRSTQRDFCRLQQIVHHFRFLRLPASTSKLTCRSFSFFWSIRSRPADQLFLVYGDASGSIKILSTSPRRSSLLQRTSSARGRGCHIALVLRVALGDNKSLNYDVHASHFNSRDLTKREKTGAMSFFTSSSKTIKRSSNRRTRSSRQRIQARFTYERGQPSNSTLATTFFWQRGNRYQSSLLFIK